ncbi:FAD-binding domain-containing protein [Mycena rosella]|uniref:FAD-binding domain-containing protein n=1 Tax=Mycena rosella TaxID=1033263 RepID=A0AAD7D796_MYCRO|nr:FAD-binding domain-containing protein [Mycena rosella]
MVPFFQLLLGLAAIVSANSTTTGSQLACRALSTGPLSTFVKSSGAEFQAGVTSAWNLLNVELTPACIVFPETTEHVSIAMTAIHSFKATYAVQSGGHSAMQGWNNVQAGVLIHFMNMRNISHDQASSSVTFQPGLTWGEALDALEPLGVAVAGGRVSDVGTGLLLGGGLSFLASAVGYSVDTLREVDVVLVTGKVVTATVDNEYADLFRALKGGANRFGIYDNASAEVLLEAVARFPKNVDDPKAAFLLYFVNSFSDGLITPFIILNAFYEGTSLPNSSFGEFLAIPSIQTNLTALSYHDISNIIADQGPPPVVELYGASVLQGSDDVVPYREIFALYTQFCQTAKDEVALTTLAFTPVMDSQIKAGRARGGNAIDAPHGGFHLVQFSLSLPPGPKNISAGLAAARQTFFNEAPRTPGLPLYVAESDKSQHVFETYGGYEFLKQTYRKYDPERFNVQYTDGPTGL